MEVESCGRFPSLVGNSRAGDWGSRSGTALSLEPLGHNTHFTHRHVEAQPGEAHPTIRQSGSRSTPASTSQLTLSQLRLLPSQLCLQAQLALREGRFLPPATSLKVGVLAPPRTVRLAQRPSKTEPYLSDIPTLGPKSSAQWGPREGGRTSPTERTPWRLCLVPGFKLESVP